MAMQFLQPFMLWSLLLMPMMVVGYLWLLKRRRKQVVAFSAVSWILQNMDTPSPWRRHVPPALLAMALVLLLLAIFHLAYRLDKYGMVVVARTEILQLLSRLKSRLRDVFLYSACAR